MISYGLERQRVFVLGFALAQNATSRRVHSERHTTAQDDRAGIAMSGKAT
ncbi:hypothetical protein [Streptomyces sp. NPDC005322]